MAHHTNIPLPRLRASSAGGGLETCIKCPEDELRMAELSSPSQSGSADEWRLLLTLLTVCVVMITAATLLLRVTAARAAPAAFGDMSQAAMVEIHDASGKPLLSGEFRSRVDGLGNTEKDAALVDPRGSRVVGEIEIEIPAPGRSDRRPELEVDIIGGLPPNQTFSVVIDSRPIATFRTDDRGSVDMEIVEGEIPPP